MRKLDPLFLKWSQAMDLLHQVGLPFTSQAPDNFSAYTSQSISLSTSLSRSFLLIYCDQVSLNTLNCDLILVFKVSKYLILKQEALSQDGASPQLSEVRGRKRSLV
jgi:hypothetical protein